MIRAAFFGTPDEAVPVMRGLGEVAEVAFVVTRRDAPQGRSGAPVPPPVKVVAEESGIAVHQPGRLAEVLEMLHEVDVAVLAAFGRLIPPALLNAPAHGFVNLHYSLLPRWRGASPVVRAILAGDPATGVTLMQMDEGLDTGPVYATASLAIGSEETAGELTARLAALGGELIAEKLPDIVFGRIAPVAQDEAGATAAAKVEVAEAFLDPLRHSASAVHRAVRAFNPKPGAWGVVAGERIKVWKASPSSLDAEPGVAVVVDDSVVLGCADGAVELVTVQPSGRAPMSAGAWMNGRRGEPARFTPPATR